MTIIEHPPSRSSHFTLIGGLIFAIVLAGGTVWWSRAQDKKARWELYSNHSGEFAQRVPPGKADYVITADLKDYKSSDNKPLRVMQEVTIHVEYDERVDTGLHLTNK